MALASNVKGHPKALYMLFGTEAMERLSYYGMRALLVLYLVDATRGGFGWDQSKALQVYGIYTGLVYLTPLLGGFLADRYLGQRNSVLLGGLLMMLGNFMLAITGVESTLWAGLGLLVIGNGFFKPNISTMVGGLYEQGDARRDSAFTIFYMGINLGAFFSPLVCGTLGEKVGWGYGFASAGVGMAIGLATFALLQKRLLGDVGLAPQRAAPTSSGQPAESAAPLTRVDWQRMGVIGIFVLFSIFFWTAFEQAGGLMSLYTDTKVDRMIGSFEVPTTWYQSVNPVFIVLLGPIFATLWTSLGRKGMNPNSAAKMGLGVITVGLAFVLMLGAAKEAEATGKAGQMWIIGFYLLSTLGELCLSPVGLSAVTKLAPTRFASLMMGLWFLSSAIANYLAGAVGTFAEKLGEYQLFGSLAAVCIVAGAVLLVVSPLVKKMMHGAEDNGPAPEQEKQPKLAA